jgi:hypothetical protein
MNLQKDPNNSGIDLHHPGCRRLGILHTRSAGQRLFGSHRGLSLKCEARPANTCCKNHLTCRIRKRACPYLHIGSRWLSRLLGNSCSGKNSIRHSHSLPRGHHIPHNSVVPWWMNALTVVRFRCGVEAFFGKLYLLPYFLNLCPLVTILFVNVRYFGPLLEINKALLESKKSAQVSRLRLITSYITRIFNLLSSHHACRERVSSSSRLSPVLELHAIDT